MPLDPLERVLLQDPGQRGVAGFLRPGELLAAAESLLTAERVLLLTGFPVLSAAGVWTPETDGPGGARVLGDALAALGADVVYLTDAGTAPLLAALGAEAYVPALPVGDGQAEAEARAVLKRLAPSHLVAVEVPGRASDGRYHRMSGAVNEGVTSALDELFLVAGADVTRIGLGDGGNEAGLGALREAIREAVPHGDRIATVVPAEHAVVGGTSTWAAFGLTAALARLSGEALLPTAERVRADLRAVVAAGAVDGVSGRAEACIDGLDLDVTLGVLETLRQETS